MCRYSTQDSANLETQFCNADDWCASELCNTRLSQCGPAAGEPLHSLCGRDVECESQNCASDERCREPGVDGLVALGTPCTDDRQCATGYCEGISATCNARQLGQEGDACARDYDCSFTTCNLVTGVCDLFALDGEPCARWQECYSRKWSMLPHPVAVLTLSVAEYCNPGGMCAEQTFLTPSARARTKRERLTLVPRNVCGGMSACPLPGGGFECIDTSSSLENCGGCLGIDKDAVDCSTLEAVVSVGCVDSLCVAASCEPGFLPSIDATRCVPSV